MDSNFDYLRVVAPANAGEWGQIDVLPATADHPFKDLPITDVKVYRWTPRADVQDLFPPQHHLDLWCVRGTDGGRRLVPKLATGEACGQFIVRASAGGMAVVEHPVRNATAECRSNHCNYYRIRQLIYQWSADDKRSLKRQLTRQQDLFLHESARADLSIETVIPSWAFGKAAKRVGESFDKQIEFLTDAAKAEADRRGLPIKNDADLIRLGVLAVARQDPFKAKKRAKNQLLTLLRKALWEVYVPDRDFRLEIKNEVEDRLWDSFGKHIDLPTKEFNRWFYHDVDNLVNQITKRKRNGLSISRDEVNQALGELVWESWQVISNFVACQMTLFQKVLPEPLSPSESLFFDSLYQPQAQYGDLVQLTLHSRFPLLQPLLVESSLNHQHDADGAGVNALLIYAEMVRARREADTRAKDNTRANRKRHREETLGYVEPDKKVKNKRGNLGA